MQLPNLYGGLVHVGSGSEPPMDRCGPPSAFAAHRIALTGVKEPRCSRCKSREP